MKPAAPGAFGAQLKALRETAGYTQAELATIAGLSVHAVSALEGGTAAAHVETVRALSAARDLTGETLEALARGARAPAHATAVESGVAAAPASGRPARAAILTCRCAAARNWRRVHASVRIAGPGRMREGIQRLSIRC